MKSPNNSSVDIHVVTQTRNSQEIFICIFVLKHSSFQLQGLQDIFTSWLNEIQTKMNIFLTIFVPSASVVLVAVVSHYSANQLFAAPLSTPAQYFFLNTHINSSYPSFYALIWQWTGFQSQPKVLIGFSSSSAVLISTRAKNPIETTHNILKITSSFTKDWISNNPQNLPIRREGVFSTP